MLLILLFGAPSRPPIGKFADFYTAMPINRLMGVIRKLKGNSGRTVV
jgi:hypothetical protein